MFLGIEIGGSKLQFGVGDGEGSLVVLERLDVEPRRGAERILEELKRAGKRLIEHHEISAIGIGFGGPVDVATGRTITSHQVDGWTDFPLADWSRRTFGLPSKIANDSDIAGLAEARFGAGRGHRVVFYTNVGSGIGGALVVGGEVHRGNSGVAAELGHLRPGLQSEQPDQTLESIASGWGIAAAVQSRLADPASHPLQLPADENWPIEPDDVRQRLIEREEADEKDAADLLERCDGRIDALNTKLIAEAALDGNQLAQEVFDHAAQAFGWAIAQMVTLVAPSIVVVGGGVSLVGEDLLFSPLREYVRRYVFPPLDGTFRIVPSDLGEAVVLHGALALAAEG